LVTVTLQPVGVVPDAVKVALTVPVVVLVRVLPETEAPSELVDRPLTSPVIETLPFPVIVKV
jgi:hypothetical protein